MYKYRFFEGIKQMSREEKMALLAQLKSVTSVGLINEDFQRITKSVKKKTLGSIVYPLKKLGVLEEIAASIQRLDENTDWDTNVINARFEREYKELSRFTDARLMISLCNKLADISGADKDRSSPTVAKRILHLAAKAVDINPSIYGNDEMLEADVCEACIKEQVDNLKKTLVIMSKEDMARFKDLLNQEISKLSSADREAIKKATGLERLTSDAMVSYLKTLSGTAFVQVAGSAFGFGLYIFISTVLKALSLLVGITFPFAVYTTAASVTAFMLSGYFFILVAGLAGVFMVHKTNQKLNSHLAKMLVVVGNTKFYRADHNGNTI